MGSGRKQYRSWTPRQDFLLPPSPMEWLPEGHLAYFLMDVVGELDLREIETAVQAKDSRGTRPYPPEMMVALLLYGYCVGVYSSRRMHRATYEDVAFRVIAGGQHPFHTTIAEFRRTHLEALKKLFVQGLRLCLRAGLVKLGHVALDGTKVQANASKHKSMTYDRMSEQEERLKAEIEALLERAEQTDVAEDERYGVDVDSEDIPTELKRRERRLERLREAKAALEKEARQARAEHLDALADGCDERAEAHPHPSDRKRNATLANKHRKKAEKLRAVDDDDDPPSATTDEGLAKHRPNTRPDGTPDSKAQRNFTDPDSRLMETGGAFVQGYNCQAVVDEENQVIVAEAVTNRPPDAGHLQPMLEQVVGNCARAPEFLTADTGYWTPDVEQVGDARGTCALVATERKKHWERQAAVREGPPPPNWPPRERMRWRLQTAEGKKTYARRKAVVEPVFGQIKEARGFRRFLLRGLRGAACEWSLLALAHNLLKLFRSGWAPA